MPNRFGWLLFGDCHVFFIRIDLVQICGAKMELFARPAKRCMASPEER